MKYKKLLLVLGLTGCVSLPREPAPAPSTAGAHFPVHIAALPVFDKGISKEGAIIIRAFAAHKLDRERGYLVQKLEETDAGVQALFLTSHPRPGQDPMQLQNPSVLASRLGVEGLLYGELYAFSKTTLGFYHQVKINFHFWLTDAEGKKLWETNRDVAGGGFASGAVPIDVVLTDGWFSPETQEVIRHSDLSEIAYQIVEDSFSSFPPHR